MAFYRTLAEKSPFVPLYQKGDLPNEKNFPSLKKHALSSVEGRGQGRFSTRAAQHIWP